MSYPSFNVGPEFRGPEMVPHTPGRMEQFEQNRAKANTTMTRMALAYMLPNGYNAFRSGAEVIGGIHNVNVDLRRKDLQSTLLSQYANLPGPTIEAKLQGALDRVLPDDAAMPGIRPKLQRIITAIAVNPADLAEGNTVPGNMLYFRKGSVNYDAVAAMDKELEAIQRASTLTPRLGDFAGELRHALGYVRGIDPVRTAQNDWLQQFHAGRKMDTRFIKAVGGLVGGLLTSIGLGHTLLSKEHSFSPATAFWAAVTAFSVNPGMLFQSRGDRTLANLRALGQPSIVAASRTLTPTVIDDLDHLSKDHRKEFRETFIKPKPGEVNPASFEKLVADGGDTIRKFATSVPDGLRVVQDISRLSPQQKSLLKQALENPQTLLS